MAQVNLLIRPFVRAARARIGLVDGPAKSGTNKSAVRRLRQKPVDNWSMGSTRGSVDGPARV